MHGSLHHNQRESARRDTSQQRRFGALLTLIAAIGVAYLHFKQAQTQVAALLVLLTLTLAVVTVQWPGVLRRPLQAWLAFGLLLGRIVSPVVLAIIYYLLIAPVAVIGRWNGRDELRMKRDAHLTSYWIDREAPGPTADSFHRQF